MKIAPRPPAEAAEGKPDAVPPTSRFPGDAVLELQRLSARISSDLSPVDAARAVLEHATSTLGASRARAILVDEAGQPESIVGSDVDPSSADAVPPDLASPLEAVAALEAPVFLGTDDEVARRYPAFVPFRREGGAVASLPLESGAHRLGVLFVVFDWQGSFSEPEQQLLLALADVCAGVIERARLAARERLTRSHLDFLSDASRALAESLDLGVTMQTAASLAIPILADGAILDVRSPDGDFQRVVSLPAAIGSDATVLRTHVPASVDADHPVAQAMREARTVRYEVSDDLIARATSDDEHRAAALRARGRFAITSPLILVGAPFGAITLHRSNAGAYSDEEIRIAEEFARRAARAIENSRLHSDHQRALAQANALVRLNAAAADARSPDAVAGLLLDAVVPLLDAKRGAVFEHDATTGELVVSRVRGDGASRGDRIAIAGTAAEAAIEAGEVIIGGRADIEAGRALPTPLLTESAGYLVAPLIAGGERLGVIALGFDDRPAIAPPLLATFHGLIDAGAQAVARATLLEEQGRLLERESAVARLNEAVAEARAPEDVARVLLTAAFERFDPRSASVALLDEATNEFSLAGLMTGRNPMPKTRSRWPADMPSPARDVVRSRNALVLDPAEYRARYADAGSIDDPTEIETYVAMPLVAGSHAVGALALTFSHRRQFGTSEIEDLRAIVDAGGSAIERARLREAERRALGLLETVVSELPVGVVIVDAATQRVIHANATVAEILGREPRLGIAIDTARTVMRMPDGRPLPVEESPLVVTARDGVPAGPVEVVLVREDATERRVILEAMPVRDDAGRLLAAAGTWSDITDRRSAEAAREAFLGILSHELRTPITSILAGSGILARRALGDEEAGLVSDINAESERLHRLVEDLLVLSRVERGADLRRADPVLVQHVGRRVMAHEASRWPDRRFEAKIPAGVPAASGDEAYVEQIIRNLLSNAAKYGPVGGEIDLIVSAEPDGVAIRVQDEGPGFAPEDVGRVFDLFYRSQAATKVAPGAGIGLYTSRVLAEAMGGRIWATNRDSGGGEVGVLLPFSTWDSEG